MQRVWRRDFKRRKTINDNVTVDTVLDATAASDSDALWANFEATERELVFA